MIPRRGPLSPNQPRAEPPLGPRRSDTGHDLRGSLLIPMTRLLILVDDPAHLSREEAGAWLRAAFDELEAAPGVQNLELCRLEAAGPSWLTAGDWLIEFQVLDRETAQYLVDGPEGSALLADLRRLGMHPSVQVVDG